ncbi:MAG: DsbA family protein [Candidatus Acidiferrales bacterium]
MNHKMTSARWRFLASSCALLLLASAVVAGGEGAAARAQTQAAASTKQPAKTSRKKVSKTAQEELVGPPNKTVGSKSAAITMEVFSDYMCPQCRNFYETTLRAMMVDYVPQGKVYLIHRDFPLPIAEHRFNWDAARWGTAAARIGKFEEVDAALYDNEPAWGADGDIQKYVAAVLSPSELKRVQRMVAPCLNQTPPSLRPAVPAGESCSLDAFINQDIALGKQVPVQATPTYVISKKGQRLPAGSGSVSWPIMKQFLDSLLSQ